MNYCAASGSERLFSPAFFLNAAVICRCGVEQSSCKLIPSFVLELNFVSSKLYSICYHPKQTISNLISIKFQKKRLRRSVVISFEMFYEL